MVSKCAKRESESERIKMCFCHALRHSVVKTDNSGAVIQF